MNRIWEELQLVSSRGRVGDDEEGSIVCFERPPKEPLFVLDYDGCHRVGIKFAGKYFDLSCSLDHDLGIHRVFVCSSGFEPVPFEVESYVARNFDTLLVALNTADSLDSRIEELEESLGALRRRVNPTRREVQQERKLAASIRWKILQRDGHRCRYCGCTPDKGALRVDHVVPVSKGGKSTPDNLVTALPRMQCG